MRYTILMMLAAASLEAQPLRFDFESTMVAAPGFQKVLPGTLYSEAAGYGFEEPARLLSPAKSVSKENKGTALCCWPPAPSQHWQWA